MKDALIIFIRNPELGKVKTRLAATVGNERALEIYLLLMNHTKEVAFACNCDKFVFATGDVLEKDWKGFYIEQQSDGDLGYKMSQAFAFLFQKNYERVIIIGSDCLELSVGHLLQAFSELNDKDVVIGPANDGGYYLLGMKKNNADIFLDKEWGKDSVFNETLATITKLGLSIYQLENLTDIDEEKDLPVHLRTRS